MNSLDELAIPPPPYPTRRFMATLTTTEKLPQDTQDAADLRAAAEVEKAEAEQAKKSAQLRQAEEDARTLKALGHSEPSESAPTTDAERITKDAAKELQADARAVKEAIVAVPPITQASPDIIAQDEKNKAAAIAAIEQTTAANVQKISLLPKNWPVRTAEQVASEALGEIATGKTQPSQPKTNFPKERAAFNAELRASEGALKKLEDQGQGNSPQAQKELARIDSLGAQLDEITPRETLKPVQKFTGLNLNGRPATVEEQEEIQNDLKKNLAFGGRVVTLGNKEVLVKTENGVTRTRDLGTPPSAQEPARAFVSSPKRSAIPMHGTVSARPLQGGGIEQTATTDKSKVVEVFDRSGAPRRTSAFPTTSPEPSVPSKPSSPIESTPAPKQEVISVPPRTNYRLAHDIAEATNRLGDGRGAGRKPQHVEQPKSTPTEPVKDFDIEFKQPPRESNSPESKQKLLHALNAYRDASEQFGEKDPRTMQAKARYRQLENPPQVPSKRFNLLNNPQSPEVRMEVPPRPGMPGGPIRESLRQAVPQTESAKPRPEVGTVPDRVRVQERLEPSDAEQDLDEIPDIKEMGEDHPPRWWERVGLNMESSAHDLLAWVASVRAKKAESNLVGKEKKVRKLEKEAQDLADKNWLGALMSPIKYSARTSWYRWREGNARAALERHQDSQERHENVRNEVINIMANQFDTALKTQEGRAQAFAERSDQLNAELDDLDATLSAVNARIAVEKNSVKREKLLSIRDAVTEKFEQEAEERDEMEVGFQRANAQAIRLQRIKNQILKKATPTRTVSVRKARKVLKTRQKTSMAGRRQGTIPHHEPKPGEEEQLRRFEQEAA